MNKNIIRVGIIIAVIVTSALLIRLFIGISSSRKETPMPKVSIETNVSEEYAVLNKAKSLLQEGRRAEAIGTLEAVVSSNKGEEPAYQSLIALADIYKTDQNFLKAKELYNAILYEYSNYCDYPQIQKELNSLNMAILFSVIPTPDSEIYTVVSGDSLIKIAKRYKTTVDLIKKANGLKSDLIMPGMKFKVGKIPFSIVVDKSQSTLTLLLGDEVIKIYMVSTGKNNSTPTGDFKIKDKLIDPVWYGQGAIVPPDSPENVLGSRWMGITAPESGYGIHGTIEPESIGYQCTEGCVRMRNQEVEELFSIVPVGTKVSIID